MFKIDDTSIQIPSVSLRALMTVGAAAVLGQVLKELEDSGIIPDELMEILVEYKASVEILMEEESTLDELGEGTSYAVAIIDMFKNIFEDILESASIHHVSVTFAGIVDDHGNAITDPPNEQIIMELLVSLLDEANSVLVAFVEKISNSDYRDKEIIQPLFNAYNDEVDLDNKIEVTYSNYVQDKFDNIKDCFKQLHKFVHAEYDMKISHSALKEKYLKTDNLLQEIKFFFDDLSITQKIDKNISRQLATDINDFEFLYFELKYLLGFHPELKDI
ncbi:MAG: hypothetical protein HON94_02580 [Methylococcales bacterium]|jgi:hypothetical protein|nr:hypothetical protein [Methylococcales bacterium]MBT7409736.1 hypothetical protein [Methylococcales bacterium]